MGRKGGINHQCLDITIFNDIKNFGYQIPSFPYKGCTRFQYEFDVGISIMEIRDRFPEKIQVISLPGYQMASTKIQPLNITK